jgi:hypothetical protein
LGCFSFPVRDFHSLFLADLPAHQLTIMTITGVDF